MRWRLLFIVGVACAWATPADSNPHGHDLWQMNLSPGVSGRWVFLDAGRARLKGQATPLILLGLARDDRPAGRYYEMKVVDGRSGATLWTYDGTGSDYVAAGGSAAPGERHAGDPGGDAWSPWTRPQLRDVDGDDSDDVLFVEQDFVLGTLLRAVRIEP
jgi:hypothetical protein